MGPGIRQWDTREALPIADGAWDPARLSTGMQGAQGRREGCPWQREEQVGWPKWGSMACPRTWQRVSLTDWRRGPGDAGHCHPCVQDSNRVGGCAHKDPTPVLRESVRPKQRRPRPQATRPSQPCCLAVALPGIPESGARPGQMYSGGQARSSGEDGPIPPAALPQKAPAAAQAC